MMKIYVRKDKLLWLKEMQDEGRTREIEISNYKKYVHDVEIEIEINENLVK